MKMKKKTRATIALLLVSCLLVSLAACGGGGGGTVNDPAAGIGGEEEGTLREEGYVFVPEFMDVDVPGMWPRLVGIYGETLYIQYTAQSEENPWGGASVLATIRTDGSGHTPLWTGVSDSWEENDIFYNESEFLSVIVIRPGGGILAIRQESSSFSGADDWGWSESMSLIALSPEGTVEREVDLSVLLRLPEGFGGVNQVQELSDGRVLVGTWERLYVLTPDWTMDFERAWPQDVDGFLVTRDDQVLVSTWDFEEGRTETWLFDLATSDIVEGSESLFAADIRNTHTGAEFDLYVGTRTAVFGFDMDTGRSTQLFDWMDMDVLDGPTFVASDAGEIFFFEQQWGGGGQDQQNTLVRLSMRDAAEVPTRTEIVYGGLFVDFNIRREIVEFNRRNTEYRIRIREYMDWMTWDIEDAVRRLNTDIITGNAPDILDFGRELPFEHYARRGFLRDIGALIDADSGMNRGDFLESTLDLLTVDGTLYTVMSEFNVQTLTGRRDRVGPDMGWTMAEFLAAVDALPEGGTAFDEFVTRQWFTSTVLNANLGLFIDRETGRADFDSPLFMDYLTFAMTLPTEEDRWGGGDWGSNPGDWARPMPASPAALRLLSASPPIEIEPPIGTLPPGGWENPFATGQVLLAEQFLWSFSDLVWMEEQFGGPVTFKGFPSEEGIGGVLAPQNLIGISATTQHVDAAWGFVRTLLTERWQRENVSSFPTNRTILEERIQQSMEVPAHIAREIESGDWAPPIATQAQIDQIMALITGLDMIAMRDSTVVSLIEEELLPFFAGDRSIQETVRIIQNRVQTYLSERG